MEALNLAASKRSSHERKHYKITLAPRHKEKHGILPRPNMNSKWMSYVCLEKQRVPLPSKVSWQVRDRASVNKGEQGMTEK